MAAPRIRRSFYNYKGKNPNLQGFLLCRCYITPAFLFIEEDAPSDRVGIG
jgi:hypothetical protein